MTTTVAYKALNLDQLADELAAAAGLNAPPPLSSGTTEGSEAIEVTCHHEAITQAILDATIDAHVPAPPPPTDAEQIAALKARLAATQAGLDEVIIGALMGEFPPS